MFIKTFFKIIGAVLAVGSLITIAFGFDARYMRMTTHEKFVQEDKVKYDLLAQEVKRVEREHEYKFQLIRLKGLRDRIEEHKGKYLDRKMDKLAQEHLKYLEEEMTEVQETMKKLEDKK